MTEVPVLSLGRSNGWLRAVRVRCPFCDAEHVHGWPITAPETTEMLRFASCTRRDRYLVVCLPAAPRRPRSPRAA